MTVFILRIKDYLIFRYLLMEGDDNKEDKVEKVGKKKMISAVI